MSNFKAKERSKTMVTVCFHRMEDITPPEEIEKNPKCDRRVTLYGYNRGLALKNQQAIHIAGEDFSGGG